MGYAAYLPGIPGKGSETGDTGHYRRNVDIIGIGIIAGDGTAQAGRSFEPLLPLGLLRELSGRVP